jgi:hypothetical protein
MNSLRPCFSSSATNCTTPSELDHAVASSSLQHHSYKPRAAVQIRLLLRASLPPSCGVLAMRSLARPPRPPDHHGRIIMLLLFLAYARRLQPPPSHPAHRLRRARLPGRVLGAPRNVRARVPAHHARTSTRPSSRPTAPVPTSRPPTQISSPRTRSHAPLRVPPPTSSSTSYPRAVQGWGFSRRGEGYPGEWPERVCA